MIYNKLKLKAFILFLIGFGMFFSTNISAQDQKIEDEVRRNFESDPIQRVFVWLNDYIKVDDFRKTNNRGRDQATVTILKLLINKSNQSQLALSSKIEKEFGNTPVEWTYITNGFEIETNWQTIQKIAKWPEVKGIYADKKPTTNATIDFSPPTIVGAQPGLKSINAHKMWEMGYTGHGTKAFIFDSGEDYNHPAIRSNFNGNFAGFNKSWSGGHDRPFDVGGHGTHVTGTICGIDILGKDTIGVAFGATWIGGPIQFNNSPKQPYKVKSFAQNFQYAINPDGDSTTTEDLPDVINNSWGDEGATNCEADDPLSEILKLFELAGVAVVWSAGNSGPNARTVDYYQGLNYSLISGFSVGATAINKPFAIADFSSRGPSECAGDDPLDPLAIKPEVSAPGVGVRSSYLNGSYALLNGTSMAAPHVSGAVLLLKEAFPYLSGNDFLMALYMSAVDLGASGEDNVYGRGIIDVYAAYLLLIENGNQPVAPASKKVDVAIIDFIETSLSPYCKDSQQFNTVIYNAGIDTIYSFTLDVATDNNGTYHSDTIEWYGILLPQDTLFIILPAQYFAFGGPTIVKVGVQLPADSQESRILNNTWQREINVIDNTSPEVAINAPQKVCIGSNVLLTAENLDSDELIPAWYADATSSAPMGEGVNFIIGPVVENTSVFMEPLLHKELVYSYEIEKFKTTLIRNTGLVFDVKKDSYLNAVTVYIAKEGTYVFRLIDDKSVAIKTISASLKVGPQELKFETFMKTGDNFKLLMSLGKELGINEYDFTKAINIGDAITIKESTGFTEEENKKVFANFFDWKIAVAFPCGRKEYKIEVNEKDTIEGLELLIPDSLDLTDSNELLIQSTILDSSFIYNWTISNSPASNDPSFKVVFDSTGLYECSLLAIDSTGCSNFVSKHIFVYHENTTSVPEIQALASFTVVPNPSVSYFSLISKDYFGALSLVMHDSSGRLVKRILTYNLGDHVNIEDLTSGVYFLNIMDAKSSQVVKLVKP